MAAGRAPAVMQAPQQRNAFTKFPAQMRGGQVRKMLNAHAVSLFFV